MSQLSLNTKNKTKLSWPLPEPLCDLPVWVGLSVTMSLPERSEVYRLQQVVAKTSIVRLWEIYQTQFSCFEKEKYRIKMVTEELLIAENTNCVFVASLRITPDNPSAETSYTLFRSCMCSTAKSAEQSVVSLFFSHLMPENMKECKGVDVDCSEGKVLVEVPFPNSLDTRDSIFDLNGHSVVEQAMELLTAIHNWRHRNTENIETQEGGRGACNPVRRYVDPTTDLYPKSNQNRTVTQEFQEIIWGKKKCAEDGSLVAFRWSVTSKRVQHKFSLPINEKLVIEFEKFKFTVTLWREQKCENSGKCEDNEENNEKDVRFTSSASSSEMAWQEAVKIASLEAESDTEPITQLFYRCVMQAAEELGCANLMDELFMEYALFFSPPYCSVVYRVGLTYFNAFFSSSRSPKDIPLVSGNAQYTDSWWTGTVEFQLDHFAFILPPTTKVIDSSGRSDEERSDSSVACPCYVLYVKSKKDFLLTPQAIIGVENFSFVLDTLIEARNQEISLPNRYPNIEVAIPMFQWALNHSYGWSVPSPCSALRKYSNNNNNKTTNSLKLGFEKNTDWTELSLSKLSSLDESISPSDEEGRNREYSSTRNTMKSGEVLLRFAHLKNVLDLQTRGFLQLMDTLWKPFFEVLYIIEYVTGDAQVDEEKNDEQNRKRTLTARISSKDSEGSSKLEDLKITKSEGKKVKSSLRGTTSEEVQITMSIFQCSINLALINESSNGQNTNPIPHSCFPEVIEKEPNATFVFSEKGRDELVVCRQVLFKALIVLTSYRKMLAGY